MAAGHPRGARRVREAIEVVIAADGSSARRLAGSTILIHPGELAQLEMGEPDFLQALKDLQINVREKEGMPVGLTSLRTPGEEQIG